MLLTPRWAGRLVLLVLVVAACVWLGQWQWDVAHTTIVRTPPPGTSSLLDVHEVGRPVDPDQAGQRVWLRGEFDDARQLQVVDRLDDGERGTWVVTAMLVTGGDTGAAIPVVRGWLPEGEPVPPPPRGEQRIEGWLEPSEPDLLRDSQRGPLAPGEIEIVSSPELLSLWQPPLYQGFVIQDEPEPTPPLSAVTPPADRIENTDWQNAAYAVQWWFFGLFAVFWFIRMMRVEREDASADSQSDVRRPAPIAEVGKMAGSDGIEPSSREGPR
jgi:cytochrome oxidase assembly protein ShyY1